MSNSNNRTPIKMIIPQTPPKSRCYGRGSKLVPSYVVTPSKTPYGTPLTSRRRGVMTTTPHRRYHPNTPSSTYDNNNNCNNTNSKQEQHQFYTPCSTMSKLYQRQGSNNSDFDDQDNHFYSSYASSSSPYPATPERQPQDDTDRFIPSRKRLNIDLCRRALLSDNDSNGNNGNHNPNSNNDGSNTNNTDDPDATSSSPATANNNNPEETPLQKEFKRRMLSALCNVPLDNLTEDAQPASLLPTSNANSLDNHNNNNNNTAGKVIRTAFPHVRNSKTKKQTILRLARGGAENIFPSGRMMMAGGGGSGNSGGFGGPVVNPFEHDTLRQIKVGRMTNGSTAHRHYSIYDDEFYSDPHDRRTIMSQKVMRKVPSSPIRILDAPDIVDDYYLNLISWSKDNILAVALAQCVYLWNAGTGEIQHLCTLEHANDYVTSVAWCTLPGQTHYIAVGTNLAVVHLFDGKSLRKVRTLDCHAGRVSALAWNLGSGELTSGARDSNICTWDARAPSALNQVYRGHEQEVCGLKWNDEGTCLASGGNENFLCLWDARQSARRGGRAAQHNNRSDVAPRLILRQHKAAVKALDWCPFHRGLLASGGGTADRTIKFWNTNSGVVLNSVDTGSQVCSVVWSKTHHQRELCSSHGYSENQLILWKYPTMTKIKELKGHTARVLNMEMSPDGASVVSAAADETLRFWNVFTSSNASNGSSDFFGLGSSLFSGANHPPRGTTIR